MRMYRLEQTTQKREALPLAERIRRYVEKCPEAISGEHGHDTTYRVAIALVWGFGLSPERALPFLQEYSARCKPPWTNKELRHKLSDALRSKKHRLPRGHLL